MMGKDDLEQLTRLPDDFCGRVRLFPLPGLVMFPHVMQPLHIFEPRYCEMLAEALAADRLIAMATLEPACPLGVLRPPIARAVCIGRIVTHAAVEHDRHNILLVGVRRARVVEEFESGRPFRTARVEVLEDVYSPSEAAERPRRRRDLLRCFQRFLPNSIVADENFRRLADSQLPLGMVTDVIAFAVSLTPEVKLTLLGDPDVDRRADLLIRHLQRCGGASEAGFPPPFSPN